VVRRTKEKPAPLEVGPFARLLPFCTNRRRRWGRVLFKLCAPGHGTVLSNCIMFKLAFLLVFGAEFGVEVYWKWAVGFSLFAFFALYTFCRIADKGRLSKYHKAWLGCWEFFRSSEIKPNICALG